MRFSDYANHLTTSDGATAWALHAEALRRARRDTSVIVLSIGDHDRTTPAPIVAAAVASLNAGRHHYADSTGTRRLREALAGAHRLLSGVEVSATQIAATLGGQTGLFLTVQALFDPSDEVIAFDPMYVTYADTLASRAVTVRRALLRADNAFQPDVDAAAALITPRTRGLLINSPNNPTGAVFTRANLERLAALAIEHDLWMISDEVYAALTYETEHISPAALPGMAEHSVVINSFSKSHIMTGWRSGWVAGPAPFIERLGKISNNLLFGLPTFIQDAAVVAAEGAAEFAADVNHLYRVRRDHVCNALVDTPGLRFAPPAGAMFLLIDVSATGLDGLTFAQRLLDEERVSLLPGEGFGASLKHYVRLSFCQNEARLDEACQRIRRFTERLMGVPGVGVALSTPEFSGV